MGGVGEVVGGVNHSEQINVLCPRQLSAHPLSNFRVIMQAIMVERTAECNKVRRDVVRLVYLHLGKKGIFCISYSLRKQSSPLPAERLSWLYLQWLLIWMQFVKRVCGKKKCVFEPIFLVHRGEIKGSETFSRLIFLKKMILQ